MTIWYRNGTRSHDLVRNLCWINGREVAFLWDDGKRSPFVEALDVVTHKLRTLAQHTTSIVEYSVSAQTGVLIYTASRPVIPGQDSRRLQAGFVVGDESIYSVLDRGSNRPRRETDDQYQTFIVGPQSSRRRMVKEPPLLWLITPELLSLSPNGQYAVAVRPAAEIPKGWESYTEHIFKDVYLPAARRSRKNWFSTRASV